MTILKLNCFGQVGEDILPQERIMIDVDNPKLNSAKYTYIKYVGIKEYCEIIIGTVDQIRKKTAIMF